MSLACFCADTMALPGGASGKEPCYQCWRRKRGGFDPWVGKVPWRRACQPTPVFLPEESHRQSSLEGSVPGAAQSRTRLKQRSLVVAVQVLSHVPLCDPMGFTMPGVFFLHAIILVRFTRIIVCNIIHLLSLLYSILLWKKKIIYLHFSYWAFVGLSSLGLLWLVFCEHSRPQGLTFNGILI